MGSVSVVNSNGTVDVTRAGSTYPNVRLLTGYVPFVGDVVQILKSRGGWVCLGRQETSVPDGTVVDMRAGRVLITPSAANTPTTVTVTYPALRGNEFQGQVTPSTTVPGTQVTGCATTSVGQTQMTIALTRTNTTATWVHWTTFGTR
jgi:hypothetical protein